MAAQFSDVPQVIDAAETHINRYFDHLIACVNEGRAQGELCWPHAVAVDPNLNKIYVTEGYCRGKEYSNTIARVSIFSETGEFLNAFSHPHMEEPWGIAIHRDNVYVTDIVKHSVFHFKMEADFLLVARLGERGSGIGQFNEPRQLAVSTNGYIFVTDRDNSRVKILDSMLHYQRHISHHSMSQPLDIKLTSDEVFVLCQTSPCVNIFSYTGDLIRSLIARGGIGVQLTDPSFFCLDSDCNLLLSDCWGHQIKIFSKKGALLHTLGNCGHKVGMFIYPQGIALINNQKIVIVSKNRNYSLQIYSSH